MARPASVPATASLIKLPDLRALCRFGSIATVTLKLGRRSRLNGFAVRYGCQMQKLPFKQLDGAFFMPPPDSQESV